jgi:NADPH-dependent curcumin reductase CurA
MSIVNRQVVLAARPAGFPSLSDFSVVEAAVGSLVEDQILIEVLYLSVDPYMRGRMRAGPSYAPPVEIGQVMSSGGVGRVIQSRNPRFQEGDIIEGMTGWQEYVVTNGKGFRKVDPSLAPVSTALGVLGMPGLTAYFGLTDLGKPKAGETVMVSGAAGAVGSAVGQIAKILGCRAVGTAGGEEKVHWLLEDLGFDAAYNYKDVTDHRAKLGDVCPNGIDVYFDNTGGPVTDGVLMRINERARIVLCGQISQYNEEKHPMGPRLLFNLVIKRARIEGFLIFDYAARYREGLEQLGQWVREGKLKYREQFEDGLENTPRAFLEMLRGANTGKMLVRLKPEKGEA